MENISFFIFADLTVGKLKELNSMLVKLPENITGAVAGYRDRLFNQRTGRK
jgi:hypothetical protein